MRAILTYHSLDSSGSAISVSPQEFARHVAWLASGSVRVTTVAELIRTPDDVDAVAITFDDAFRNFGEVAAPLLASHGLPSTLFVVSDYVGRTNEWGDGRQPEAGIPILPLLDWPELSVLAAQGVQVAAHSRTHPRLSSLSGDALADEIAGSARIIEDRVGCRASGFAYPYGDVSEQAATVVSRTFAWGCTTELRPLTDARDVARLPRLDMYYFRAPGRLESWGTTRFNTYLTLRAHARRFRLRFASSVSAP